MNARGKKGKIFGSLARSCFFRSNLYRFSSFLPSHQPFQNFSYRLETMISRSHIGKKKKKRELENTGGPGEKIFAWENEKETGWWDESLFTFSIGLGLMIKNCDTSQGEVRQG